MNHANDRSTMHERLHVSSPRAYALLISVAALSGAALHMVRSTTAADRHDRLAQPHVLPIEPQHKPIDTSLQPLAD